MSENIDYKSLYELIKIENARLEEQNIELTRELDKYKMLYGRKYSYAENIELIIEELNKEKEKEKKKLKK